MQTERSSQGEQGAAVYVPGNEPGRTEVGLRLGGARADFVAGLGRKVHDLRNALGKVRQHPTDAGERDSLRRKLHALGSGARIMKFDAMDRAIAEAVGTLDRSPQGVSLEDVDLDNLEQVLEDLPALAWGEGLHERIEPARPSLTNYTALVVGSAQIAEALLEPLRDRPVFSCESTPDAQAAFDLAKKTQPDLVVLDADVDAAAELVDALMDEPLTEATPIVVVGSFLTHGEASRYVAMGVAKTITKPTSREMLRKVCEQALEPNRPEPTTYAVFGEPTLDELGDRLVAELREALVGNIDPAIRARKIPIGEGTEITGALWGAIARVREIVTARSDGEVRFASGPAGGMAIAPSLEADLARSDRMRSRLRGPANEVRLAGRRVVVADDDPGVVWFLTDLLKTAGCVVHEAFDGQQALDLAFKHSPDLVISDILMPKLDGFSLCRALRRDIALRDTPVVLLSWKEDLLQRVRELGAGAAAYVRKESDTRAILARIREALRPRSRIETRLREEGEVRGRLDGVSVRALLEMASSIRNDCRVSVRDASFLYEVEVRGGIPQRATRTSGDGSFLRGSRVLTAMLGVGAGRFTVATSTSPLDSELDGNLASQLAKPIARTRAATEIFTSGDLMHVVSVQFDADNLDDYLKATPERAQSMARRLAGGVSPRALVFDGGADPALVEDLLCDLAARGVVVGINGPEGADMLGPAYRRFAAQSDVRAALAPRLATPSPLPVAATPAPAPTPVPEGACKPTEGTDCESPSFDHVVMREAATPTEAQGEGRTPSADQIVALAEPTIVDNTVYGASDPAIPVDEASEPVATRGDADKTPFAAVRAEPTPAGVPAKRGSILPMVAFVAGAALLVWAVMHFAGGGESTPPRTERPAPTEVSSSAGEETTFAPIPQGTSVPAGHGVLEVEGNGEGVVLIDGTERTAATLNAGNHEVRVRQSTGERVRTLEVRSGQVTRLRL